MHLYGKHEARSGRKMGHFTVVDKNLDIAFEKAIKVRSFWELLRSKREALFEIKPLI
jgi:phosphoribosylaminoimidazole carboxylase (NCAIR synthetase)